MFSCFTTVFWTLTIENSNYNIVSLHIVFSSYNTCIVFVGNNTGRTHVVQHIWKDYEFNTTVIDVYLNILIKQIFFYIIRTAWEKNLSINSNEENIILNVYQDV